MTNENLAKLLLGSPQGMKLLFNLDKISTMVNSDEGRRLLKSVGGEGGNAIKIAAEQAAVGDTDAAKRLVTTLMSTEDGRRLIEGIAAMLK